MPTDVVEGVSVNTDGAVDTADGSKTSSVDGTADGTVDGDTNSETSATAFIATVVGADSVAGVGADSNSNGGETEIASVCVSSGAGNGSGCGLEGGNTGMSTCTVGGLVAALIAERRRRSTVTTETAKNGRSSTAVWGTAIRYFQLYGYRRTQRLRKQHGRWRERRRDFRQRYLYDRFFEQK